MVKKSGLVQGHAYPSKSKVRKMRQRLKSKKQKIKGEFKEEWGNSLHTTYKKWSIAVDPNKAVDASLKRKQQVAETPARADTGDNNIANINAQDVQEMLQNPVFKSLTAEVDNNPKYKYEQTFPTKIYETLVQKLIAKHKNNFIAMAKDIKLNVYQWTPTQCENKVKKYDEFLTWKEQVAEYSIQQQLKKQQEEEEAAKLASENMDNEEEEEKPKKKKKKNRSGVYRELDGALVHARSGLKVKKFRW